MKKVFRKTYVDAIIGELKRDKVVLLTGARQVGKTTLMHQVTEQFDLPSTYVNMEQRFGERRASSHEFLERVTFSFGFDPYSPGLLLIDEIQYFEMPDALLKSLYDDPKVQCFIIATGSRFWGQTRVGSSLVGRGSIIRVWGFSFLEFLAAHAGSLNSLSIERKMNIDRVCCYQS